MTIKFPDEFDFTPTNKKWKRSPAWQPIGSYKQSAIEKIKDQPFFHTRFDLSSYITATNSNNSHSTEIEFNIEGELPQGLEILNDGSLYWAAPKEGVYDINMKITNWASRIKAHRATDYYKWAKRKTAQRLKN